MKIEDIRPGDCVWAADPETGETGLREVKRLFRGETNEWIRVTVNDEEIVCTPDHPFWVPVKGWTKACHLRAGDRLQLLNGEYVVVEQIQHELLEHPEATYNFEVEGYHTYYVGGSGVLVHNQCKGVKPSSIKRTEVHHIVEQCQQGKSGFTSSQIQTTSNKITLDYDVHRKISGYYSSKPKEMGGLRVRDWLAGKAFEEQTEFGWKIIRQFMR